MGSPRTACLLLPLFPLAARLRSEPELTREALVVVEGNGNAARVVAATRAARAAGLRPRPSRAAGAGAHGRGGGLPGASPPPAPRPRGRRRGHAGALGRALGGRLREAPGLAGGEPPGPRRPRAARYRPRYRSTPVDPPRAAAGLPRGTEPGGAARRPGTVPVRGPGGPRPTLPAPGVAGLRRHPPGAFAAPGAERPPGARHRPAGAHP